MIIVISTQDHENYAAHGGFNGEYYWKAKGGSEFKVLNAPLDMDPNKVVEMVREHIEVDNDYFRTQIIGVSIEDNDWLSDFERSQLEYEGTIQYKEPEIDYIDLIGSEVIAG